MGTLIKARMFQLFKKQINFYRTYCLHYEWLLKVSIATKYNEIFTPQESFTSAYNGFSWFGFY